MDKIVQGATTYFLVIFTGHLLLVLFELLAPMSDHPANLYSANTTRGSLVSLMITHTWYCLKAANPQDSVWSCSTGQAETVRFARNAISGTEGGLVVT